MAELPQGPVADWSFFLEDLYRDANKRLAKEIAHKEESKGPKRIFE